MTLGELARWAALKEIHQAKEADASVATYELVMQTSGVGEFQPVVSVQVDHDARKVYLRD
jgi:hypothetical protein